MDLGQVFVVGPMDLGQMPNRLLGLGYLIKKGSLLMIQIIIILLTFISSRSRLGHITIALKMLITQHLQFRPRFTIRP